MIRHYDRVVERAIEARHGLPLGSMLPIAFGGETGMAFMLGEIDHNEFEARLAVELASTGAARELVAMRAEVDHRAVDLVRTLRLDVPVALLTNGSVRTRVELEEAGIHDAFDHVFNSAETRSPKPQAQAYLNVIEALDATPHRTAFVDDHEPNVIGAARVGLVAHHYVDFSELHQFLAGHGLVGDLEA